MYIQNICSLPANGDILVILFNLFVIFYNYDILIIAFNHSEYFIIISF